MAQGISPNLPRFLSDQKVLVIFYSKLDPLALNRLRLETKHPISRTKMLSNDDWSKSSPNLTHFRSHDSGIMKIRGAKLLDHYNSAWCCPTAFKFCPLMYYTVTGPESYRMR